MLEQRVRRPADKDDLIARLAGDSSDALFKSMRDLFVFAAALGKAHNSRKPFTSGSSEPIRLELFLRDSSHELLIQVLAVLEHSDDLEILSDDRIAERVTIFEEYVNGGLEILQAHLNTHRLVRDDDALQMLIHDHIDRHRTAAEMDLTRFADELGL